QVDAILTLRRLHPPAADEVRVPCRDLDRTSGFPRCDVLHDLSPSTRRVRAFRANRRPGVTRRAERPVRRVIAVMWTTDRASYGAGEAVGRDVRRRPEVFRHWPAAHR